MARARAFVGGACPGATLKVRQLLSGSKNRCVDGAELDVHEVRNMRLAFGFLVLIGNDEGRQRM